MDLQTTLVALVVAGCLVYAVWVLMPAVARRPVARTLLRLPLPAVLRGAVGRAAQGSNGCGCDGCDSPAAAPRDAARPVTFHARPKR